jgi:hypothetical protein
MERNQKDRERLADRWLDAALKQYGEADPRIGLEGRVLANLRAESERLAERRDWRRALAAVTAIIMVGTTIFLARGRDVTKQVVGKHGAPGVTNASGAPNSDRASSNYAVAKVTPSMAQGPRKLAHTSRPAPAVETIAEPRLGQFPAPQALSEQEEMLASYIAQFPHEAVVAARAQTETRKQDQLEIQQYASESAGMQTLD